MHGCRPACTHPLVIDPGPKQNASLHVPLDYAIVIHIMRCCWVSLAIQLTYCCLVIMSARHGAKGETAASHTGYISGGVIWKKNFQLCTGATRDLYMACRT
jgi:hypothetical protein